jgi:hypothetical protein
MSKNAPEQYASLKSFIYHSYDSMYLFCRGVPLPEAQLMIGN